MRQISIYVGLNDGDSHAQLFETEKYLSVLKNVCHSYRVPFSVHTVDGGYFHEDGSYVEETTLVLTLLDVSEDTAREIAQDLCAFFRQESVMVTVSDSQVFFVKDSLLS